MNDHNYFNFPSGSVSNQNLSESKDTNPSLEMEALTLNESQNTSSFNLNADHQSLDPSIINSVQIPGPTFSLLLHRVISNEQDSEGILIGSVQSKTVTVDNDEEMKTKRDVRIIVEGFHILGTCGSFYDGGGVVDSARVKRLIISQQKNDKIGVVGWFRFRPFTQHTISARERTIHRHLVPLLPSSSSLSSSSSSSSSSSCVFLLLSQDQQGTQTLNLKYKSYVSLSNAPEIVSPVHTEIANLQTTSAQKQGLRLMPTDQMNECLLNSNTFNNIVKKQGQLTDETQEYLENLFVDLRNQAAETNSNHQKLMAKKQRIAQLRKMLSEISNNNGNH